MTTREAEERARLRRLEERRDDLTERIHEAESRMAEIDATFCRPGYYDETPPDEVSALEGERVALQDRVAQLMEEWESVAGEFEA